MRLSALAQRPAGRAPPAALVGLLFWLAVAALLGAALERERRQAIDHARQELSVLTAVMEEYTARTFAGVDIALTGVAAHLATSDAPADDAAVREAMRAPLRHLPTVRALFVIGPDGWIRHDTDYPDTPRVSLADREYFRQYLQDPTLQGAMSQALQSRSGTGWFLAATRRITGPDGAFKGIVVAAVQLDWVSRLYTKLQLQEGQTLALLQADGRMLARFPRDDSLIGRSYARYEVFAEHLPRSRAGVYEVEGPPLGYRRIVAYRAVEAPPLVVTLTMPMATVLATWHRTLAGTLAVLAVLAVLTAAGVMLLRQQQAESRRAAAHRLAQAEAQAAAEANAKFLTFFEQGCFFSCVLALDGSVLEANQGGLRACGITRDDVVGRKLWECAWFGAGTPGEGRVQDGVVAAARGATVQTEALVRMADGSSSLMELALSPIRDGDGAVLSVAALGVDITQRKELEQRLRSQAEELAHADQRKGEFLATLSHELRNVLAPLQNGIAVLERAAPGSPPAERAQAIVTKQLAQMRNLVDDLLDISRVNSGKVRLDREAVDLRELLASVAEAARAYMEGPGHRFTTDWPDEPLPVLADRTRMQQVLTNLLGNAAKYTPAGGHVRLHARRAGGEVVVDVVDNGMGIPLEDQARVFDMFEQVAGHLQRAEGGLGIGLSLVQKLVALHEGRVEAFSDGPGRGSRFTVVLPVADAGAGSAREAAAAAGEWQR